MASPAMASQLLAGARSAAQAPQPLCSTSAAPVRLGIASQQRQRRGRRAAASTGAAAAVGEAAATQLALPRSSDPNAAARVGSFEAPLVEAQASKVDPEQPTLASVLPPFDPSSVADVAIVGAGPAGLALAAELATQGVSVALISTESKFVNNYGVWLDEFKDLGLEHTLDAGGVHRWQHVAAPTRARSEPCPACPRSGARCLCAACTQAGVGSWRGMREQGSQSVGAVAVPGAPPPALHASPRCISRLCSAPPLDCPLPSASAPPIPPPPLVPACRTALQCGTTPCASSKRHR